MRPPADPIVPRDRSRRSGPAVGPPGAGISDASGSSRRRSRMAKPILAFIEEAARHFTRIADHARTALSAPARMSAGPTATSARSA